MSARLDADSLSSNRQVGSCDVVSCDVGPCGMGPCDMGPCDMGPCDMGPCDMVTAPVASGSGARCRRENPYFAGFSPLMKS
jgi:hypothetical protein